MESGVQRGKQSFEQNKKIKDVKVQAKIIQDNGQYSLTLINITN